MGELLGDLLLPQVGLLEYPDALGHGVVDPGEDRHRVGDRRSGKSNDQVMPGIAMLVGGGFFWFFIKSRIPSKFACGWRIRNF
jgi:hypothetical protein